MMSLVPFTDFCLSVCERTAGVDRGPTDSVRQPNEGHLSRDTACEVERPTGVTHSEHSSAATLGRSLVLPGWRGSWEC